MTAVHIKKIALRKGEPLDEFDMDPGLVNLVYGLNESGKTALVEFILGSVFKAGGTQWALRDFPAGRGSQVVLSGLGQADAVFTPSREEKLDDIWIRDRAGLPPNMARLLVVKGAELDLSPGGASRDVLKEYLSSEGILDAVSTKIKSTLLKAELVDGEPKGDQRGELDERAQKLAQLELLKKLLFEAEQAMSGAQRELLNKQQRDIQKNIDLQEKAKRHRAFLLNQKIVKLDSQLKTIPVAELQTLLRESSNYNMREEDLCNLRDKLEQATEASREYDWTKVTDRTYAEKSGKVGTKSNPVFLVLTLFALAAAALLAFLGKPLLCTAAVVAGAALGLFYFKSITQSVIVNADDEKAIKEAEAGFMKRFNADIRDGAARTVVLNKVEAAHNDAERLSKDVDKFEKELHGIGKSIDSRLDVFAEKASAPADRETAIKRIELRRLKLSDEKTEAVTQLARMTVEPLEYLPDDPGTVYDTGELKRLESNLTDVNNDLKEGAASLVNIKARVQQAISKGAAADPLEDLVKALRDKYATARDEYRKFEADIIAKILVSGVIAELRKQGDQRINKGLGSDAVRSLLKNLTGHYEAIALDKQDKEDKKKCLLVTDADGAVFKLDDLSTGAREQVLLALRMGFAAKFAGQDQLFLILDDAFQHSDYKRRERLVDQVFELGRLGWQVIYFTMDDQIRELFRGKGAKIKEIGKQNGGNENSAGEKK